MQLRALAAQGTSQRWSRPLPKRSAAVVAPLAPRTARRLTAAAAGGDGDKKADEKKEKQIKEYVEALQKGGVKKEMAREVLKKWEEAAADGDPNALRKLFLKQSAVPALATTVQTLIDAAATYSIFTSGIFFAAGPDFYGRDILVIVLNVLAGYFALGVVFDIATLTTILISTVRVGTSIDAFYAALKALAGPGGAGTSGLSLVDKAQAAVNAVKVAQALDAIGRMLEGSAPTGSVDGRPASTLSNLSALLTLSRAEQRDGFDPEKLGMTEATAADLALKFSQYDLNDDGKLDGSEVRQMASKLGIELTTDEAKAAIAAMDRNSDGLVEFSEWAGWWAARKK